VGSGGNDSCGSADFANRCETVIVSRDFERDAVGDGVFDREGIGATGSGQ
jgi:hypothetical protein